MTKESASATESNLSSMHAWRSVKISTKPRLSVHLHIFKI